MKPKKSLGQNFLTSIPARIQIVKAGDIKDNDIILEIGPGKGFLTEELIKSNAKKIIVVEKDKELVEFLNEKFSAEINSKRLEVINGDALMFDPSTHLPPANGYKLVANIPYYITGAIIKRYLTEVKQPETMVLLVQKEVAERIVARDGKESILSLSVKAYGSPKIAYRVKRGSFNPIPNVDSAVLLVENISNNNLETKKHEDVFFKLVKAGFSHKRKFLMSNIKEEFSGSDLLEIFKKLDISEKARAEDVSLKDWLEMAKVIYV